NNDLEYLRGGASSRKYTTSVTKTKAADYGHIKWIEDLVPRAMWIQEPINYDRHALWGVSHWGRKRQQFYGFAVNQESALDVYSKRRIIVVTELKIVELHNYKHLDWISTNAADYGHIKWIEDLVPRTMWIEEPIGYDKHAHWGVSHWGVNVSSSMVLLLTERLQRFFRCAMFIYSFYLGYSLSLYPFTERYAQSYFCSCLIRQNALQTLLPQIRVEISEEFRTSSGPSNSGGNPIPAKNFQWGLRKYTLNHLMCMPFTDVAQVANAARNYEILHERDDDDAERPDKRQKSGDRHQPTTQQSSHMNQGHNNDRHGSDRRGGSDNHRRSNNNYSGNNNRNSGNGRDQRNRGQQSNRSANSGNSL
nr:hypothetical protein [Tanacetum cinerariifolium]